MRKLDSIESAITALKKGKLVMLVDSEERENEGDLIMAAEHATVKNLNFMASNGRGLICVPISHARALQLNLNQMTREQDEHASAFTISVDAKKSGTGISIPSRLKTIRVLANKKSRPRDLRSPGHVFPLVAREGGVLERAGHTEGSIDLVTLAGLSPISVICEILLPNGKMARLNDLIGLKKKWELKLVSIHDLIHYRLSRQGPLIQRMASPTLHTPHGKFQAFVYKDLVSNEEYFALVKGNVQNKKNVLVRVHSACLTGDVFGSLHCDCGPQLHAALGRIAKEGRGVLLYIPHHEGRGIGLANKLKAYEWQANGKDTLQANLALGLPSDKRDFGVGAQVLRDLGLSTIRVLTNNPKKLVGLNAFGLEITQQLPIRIQSNPHNRKYLVAKKEKMGHWL